MLVFYTWTVRNVADAISLMSSTEKVGWLATKTPQEGDALYTADNSGSGNGGKDVDGGKMIVSVQAGGDGAPAGWPRRGTVEFDNVWMKYLPSAPYALKGELNAPAACRLLVLLLLFFVVWHCWVKAAHAFLHPSTSAHCALAAMLGACTACPLLQLQHNPSTLSTGRWSTVTASPSSLVRTLC